MSTIVAMRGNRWWLVGIVQGGLVAALALAIGRGWIPLGVPGEWEWQRVRWVPDAAGLALAGLAVIGYALFATLGFRLLDRAGPQRTRLWLAGLGVAAVLVQVAVPAGAPAGYGLAKWSTFQLAGASGYFTTAQTSVHDLRGFWAAYPEWITRQDSLHIGTHPPGLVLTSDVLLEFMESHPRWSRAIVEHIPESLGQSLRVLAGPQPRSVRAAMVVAGTMTLLACALTIWPLYALGRSAGLPASAAWGAAALWPLVPSAILFQPTADTAYPFLATTALALAAWSARGSSRGSLALAVLAGLTLGLGMQFSLVFLPVGLIVGLLGVELAVSWRRAGSVILAVGLGFVGFTLGIWGVSRANPFVIWWHNARNHARFYTEFPRSYGAWLVENPIELAIGLGLPVAVLVLMGIRRREVARLAGIVLAVLAILTLSGRNLGEIGRLWLPFFPALVVVAGGSFKDPPRGLAATLLLLGVQVLALQALIQVVYPL